LSTHTIRSVRLRRRVEPVVAGGRHEQFDKRPACVRRRLIGVLTCCYCSAGGNGEGTQHGASARKHGELRDAGHAGGVVTANGINTKTNEQRLRTRKTCNIAKSV
jgi:hypothetical protein